MRRWACHGREVIGRVADGWERDLVESLLPVQEEEDDWVVPGRVVEMLRCGLGPPEPEVLFSKEFICHKMVNNTDYGRVGIACVHML